MECLKNLVGIVSSTELCPPQMQWATESKSGLYIDDTSKGRIPLTAAFMTNEQILEGIIPNAINEAIRKIQIQADRRLVRQYGTHRSVIGFKSDYTQSMEATSDYYFLCIKPKMINGGLVQINKVDIRTINGVHAGSFIIYQGGVEKYNGTIADYTAKTLQFSDGNIYIAYKGAAPLNFKHTGCCGKNTTYQFYSYVGSGTAASVEDFDFTHSDYCRGIEVDVVFDCYPWQFLCGLDFTTSTFGVVFAKLVQQIARSNIGYYILTDDKIGVYTQVRSEELNDIMEYVSQDIQTMVEYLPENLSMTDCYICNGVYRNEIMI